MKPTSRELFFDCLILKSQIGNLAGLQLQQEFADDQDNERGIGGFSLGIIDGMAEKPCKAPRLLPFDRFLAFYDSTLADKAKIILFFKIYGDVTWTL